MEGAQAPIIPTSSSFHSLNERLGNGAIRFFAFYYECVKKTGRKQGKGDHLFLSELEGYRFLQTVSGNMQSLYASSRACFFTPNEGISSVIVLNLKSLTLRIQGWITFRIPYTILQTSWTKYHCYPRTQDFGRRYIFTLYLLLSLLSITFSHIPQGVRGL